MKNNKLIFSLSIIWAISILALGAWWLYLINMLTDISTPKELFHPGRFKKMVLWEGSTFVILILLLSITLLYFYLKNQKKTKALQTFFAGLTHELKTPLASIRLQADVLSDLAKKVNSDQFNKLTARMVEDTQRLEIQMDKILQLSRIEQGGKLNPVPIDPSQFLTQLIKLWSNNLKIKMDCPNNIPSILADEFALELIFKNLFENTKCHSKSLEAKISLKSNNENVLIEYSDEGQFKGDTKKLGTLFYKYDSSKGSGIGLYLCKRLMSVMGGEMVILPEPKLSFRLVFPVGANS